MGKITYITDPNASISRLLISINPDGSKVIYVYGLGLISQEYTTATTVQSPNPTKTYSLFHYDYRGSTTVITNQKSEITDVITYDAYGGISGRKGNTDTLFLYVGQQGVQTDDNGLYYMRGRYYNTDIHRFINEDPIKDGLNWYAYVNGNPVMYIDPSGEFGVIPLFFIDTIIKLLLIGVTLLVIAKIIRNLGYEMVDTLEKALDLIDVVIKTSGMIQYKLPAWNKVKVDMKHIISGHTEGGGRGDGGKDKFPKGMSEAAILKAIQEAYKHAEKMGTYQYSWKNGVEQVRQFFQGVWGDEVIQFWFNHTTKTIETAWPK